MASYSQEPPAGRAGAATAVSRQGAAGCCGVDRGLQCGASQPHPHRPASRRRRHGCCCVDPHPDWHHRRCCHCGNRLCHHSRGVSAGHPHNKRGPSPAGRQRFAQQRAWRR
ncbi:hypothetical protein CHLNCDRAFT_58410 [Chlorella variabilis]|uniref:Uncharacterized protein n=1 Tax=Chlorella variabilis TaxID=554065 RepID=E1ZJ91_CHLVA|nr:hypothetical protein CHLNCDRAFT_58410 [Chlorella variabilis]EFN53954.1 hypothetical protein CHLNCDRAFT_58410 [Chlorella variabilis]|eukprot:XP_005846056.1 hypothetical protein CHLNCDRAFT_58410 [Chlorella variabilis]